MYKCALAACVRAYQLYAARYHWPIPIPVHPESTSYESSEAAAAPAAAPPSTPPPNVAAVPSFPTWELEQSTSQSMQTLVASAQSQRICAACSS